MDAYLKTHAFIEGTVRPMEYIRFQEPARTRARLSRRVAQPLGGDLSGSQCPKGGRRPGQGGFIALGHLDGL
jgi:hypothetical protein